MESKQIAKVNTYNYYIIGAKVEVLEDYEFYKGTNVKEVWILHYQTEAATEVPLVVLIFKNATHVLNDEQIVSDINLRLGNKYTFINKEICPIFPQLSNI